MDNYFILHHDGFPMQLRTGNKTSFHLSCNSYVKNKHPDLFARLRPQVAKKFPKCIAKLKEKAQQKPEPRKKMTAEQKRKRKEGLTVAEKEEEVQEMLASKRQWGRVLPVTVVVSLAMLLYSLSLSGVPMSSGLALPVILGHIRAEGYSHLLHSQQPLHIVASMKDAGWLPEPKEIFWARGTVNRFYREVGMSMRMGTGNIAKPVRPAELANLRRLMGIRLLWTMVSYNITPEFVFQTDETGVSLLPFSESGRAAAGTSEVKWLGYKDKRQFTCVPIIDGEGKLVSPTQTIWGGTEYCAKTGARLYSATPQPKHQEETKEDLYHEQSGTHWTTFGTFKRLVEQLAEHVRAVCVAMYREFAETAWVLVLDCYAVHISEAFIT